MCISLNGGPEANKSISFFVLWYSAVLSLMLLKLYFSGYVPKAEADKTDKTNTTKTAFAMIMEVNGNNGRSRGQ